MAAVRPLTEGYTSSPIAGLPSLEDQAVEGPTAFKSYNYSRSFIDLISPTTISHLWLHHSGYYHERSMYILQVGVALKERYSNSSVNSEIHRVTPLVISLIAYVQALLFLEGQPGGTSS